jgi:uncharacterized protein involved in cysteine biosynthesis
MNYEPRFFRKPGLLETLKPLALFFGIVLMLWLMLPLAAKLIRPATSYNLETPGHRITVTVSDR